MHESAKQFSILLFNNYLLNIYKYSNIYELLKYVSYSLVQNVCWGERRMMIAETNKDCTIERNYIITNPKQNHLF